MKWIDTSGCGGRWGDEEGKFCRLANEGHFSSNGCLALQRSMADNTSTPPPRLKPTEVPNGAPECPERQLIGVKH